MNRNEKLLLAFLTLAVAFAFQGSRGLYETTEGRYAEVGREMLETGNWLIPQLDYKPHWTKPPLAYWAMAGSMAVFGVNEWGVRFCNAVAFVVLTGTLVALASHLWDKRTAYIAGLIYATAPFAVAAGNQVHTDMMLSMWTLLVVLAYWRLYKTPSANTAAYWRAALGLFAGLGFLAKGPPSLLVLLAIAAFHGYLRYAGRPRPKVFSVLGLVLFAVTGLSWFFAVVFRTEGLLSYYLHDEVYARVFTDVHHRNPEWYGPFVAYLPVLLLGAGLPMAVWFLLVLRQRGLFARNNLIALLREDDRVAFLVLWLAIPIAILSFSRSRLPLYVLPHFPVIVLATARVALRLWDEPRATRNIARMAVAMALVLVAAKAAAAYVPIQKNMRQLYQTCRAASHGDTQYVAFDTEHLFGLQFYLKGKLTRAGFEPLPFYASADIAALVNEIRTEPRHDTYLFVVDRKRNILPMQSLLDSAGLVATTIDDATHYKVFVVQTRTDSTR